MPIGRTRVAPATENTSTATNPAARPSPPVVESRGCFRVHRVAPSDGAVNRSATQTHGSLYRAAKSLAVFAAGTVRHFTPHEPVVRGEPGLPLDGSATVMRIPLDTMCDYSANPPHYEERNAPVVRHVVIPHNEFTNPDYLVIRPSQDSRNSFWVTRVGNEFHLDEMQVEPMYRESAPPYVNGGEDPPGYDESKDWPVPGALPSYEES